MAGDPRFKVGVNLDGKLFGNGARRASQPAVPLDSVPTNRRRRSTRAGAIGSSGISGDGGTLLTIRNSVHMSFTDDSVVPDLART